MWWSMPLIPTVQMLWQEDQEFDALAWAILLKSNDNYNAPPKKKQHKETQKPAVLMQFLEPTESVGMEQGLSMI